MVLFRLFLRMRGIYMKRIIVAWSLSIPISFSANAFDWRLEYDGYGRVEVGDNAVRLAPKSATAREITHAALVIARESELRPLRDFRVSFRYRVRRALRQPSSEANPWETLWLFFNYRGEAASKETNYLILKSNGLEVGKAWGQTAQSFLHTAAQPRALQPRQWQHLEIERRGSRLSVRLNHGKAETIAFHPKRALYGHPGSIGLYTEDADVEVRDFILNR